MCNSLLIPIHLSKHFQSDIYTSTISQVSRQRELPWDTQASYIRVQFTGCFHYIVTEKLWESKFVCDRKHMTYVSNKHLFSLRSAENLAVAKGMILSES